MWQKMRIIDEDVDIKALAVDRSAASGRTASKSPALGSKDHQISSTIQDAIMAWQRRPAMKVCVFHPPNGACVR